MYENQKIKKKYLIKKNYHIFNNKRKRKVILCSLK